MPQQIAESRRLSEEDVREFRRLGLRIFCALAGKRKAHRNERWQSHHADAIASRISRTA